MENENQEIQKNEKNEISISEKTTNEDPVTETPSDAPTNNEESVGVGAEAPPASDPMLEEISSQLADLMEKYEEQIEKKDQKEVATLFVTPSGPIAVEHTVTLGDLLISTLLLAILIFNVLHKLIRRF